MMDKKEKEKLYIVFGILAVILTLGYYNLFLRPVFLGFVVQNREYQKVKKSVRGAEVLITKEDSINRQYENLKKQAHQLEQRLPNQEQISNLLEAFSNIAESSRVKILMVKPKETKEGVKGALYSEFPILIEAEGGYHRLGEFINKLEHMDRVIKIRAMDIKAKAQDSKHHRMDLEGITYVLQ